MNGYIEISSKDNNLIKKVVRLATDRRFREHEQLAVIYGEHLIEEAAKYNLLQQILVLGGKVAAYQPLFGKCTKTQVACLTEELMQKVNCLDSTIEIAALVRVDFPTLRPADFNRDCIVLEQIQDPGNLGTILRAAKASGIQNVILSANSVDAYNPKVLRASQGIQFGLRVYCDVSLSSFLAAYTGQILALTPRASASLYQQNLRCTTALLLGNEGSGLSQELLQQINCQVSIPMQGSTESLNLAMAATVGLFELSRQRLEA